MISTFSRVASSRLSKPAFTSSSRLLSSLSLPGSSRAGFNSNLKWYAGSAIVATTALQVMYGNTSDFYEYRFITDKDPDDIASFYGGEEFMELFCVMPIVGEIMMRGGTFDEEGTVHTQGLPGSLQVSMVFSDEFDEEADRTLWFNKRERFKDVWLGDRKMWDMVTNFGFQTLPDGRIECYHTGEYFHGNIPPISLILRLVFQLHARYVGWATEQFINNYAFTSETDEEELIEEEARTFFLWNLVKNHYWVNAKRMIFGGTTAPGRQATVKKESPEKDLSTILDQPVPIEPKRATIQPMLTIQRHSTLTKIEEDIRMDRALLRQNSMKTDAPDVKPGVTAYRHATVAARQRQVTRRRRMTEPEASIER